jgi:hypothetical protein
MDGRHPDNDLLAAFAQGLLSKSERAATLVHIADCDLCRHSVMFLAEAGGCKRTEARTLSYSFFKWVAAAGIACWLIATFLWHGKPARPITTHIELGALFVPMRTSYSFEHVRLGLSGDLGSASGYSIHFAGLKPSENQVVVRSLYGDRWLTFDGILSTRRRNQSDSTVN